MPTIRKSVALAACGLLLAAPACGASDSPDTHDADPEALAQVVGALSPGRWRSPAWDRFLLKGGPSTTELPDFSLAGYAHGDAPIPTGQSLVVDVTAAPFLAIPNDGVDDTAAIQEAVDHVGTHGGGVVLFPAGRFNVHTTATSPHLVVTHSNVVLRGSGSGAAGTVLYLGACPVWDENTQLMVRPGASEADPRRFAAVQILGPSTRRELAHYTQGLARGKYTIPVDDTSALRAGQTVRIELTSSAEQVPNLPSHLTTPATLFPQESLTVSDGQVVSWLVEIAEVVDARRIRLTQPTRMDQPLAFAPKIYSFEGLSGVGVEHLRIDSAWPGGFAHHKPFPTTAVGADILRSKTEQDYLWVGMFINHVRDGWVRDVAIANVTQGIRFVDSTQITADGVRIEGTPGHDGVHFARSHNILLQNYDLMARRTHTFTIESFSTGNVVRKMKAHYTGYDAESKTGPFIDYHGMFAYENLVEGTEGFYVWPGGDREVMPHAGVRNVFWNMGLPAEMNQGGARWNGNEFFRTSDGWDLTSTGTAMNTFEHYPQSFVVGVHREQGLAVRVAGSSADRRDAFLTMEGVGVPGVLPASLYDSQVAFRKRTGR